MITNKSETEEIEILSKRLHELANMFDTALKDNDQLEASVTIGRLIQTISEMRQLVEKSRVK